MAQWSTPPEVVYTGISPYSATNPTIATNASGITVAAWFDTNGTGLLQAAKLDGVFSNGQPAWALNNTIVSSNVQDPASPYAHSIGIDSSGNSTAVWTDGFNVYASTLALHHITWSTPLIINSGIGGQLISNLSIAVAANGNAIVSWLSSSHPYDYTVFANVFDSETQLWLGQLNILGAAVEFNTSLNPIAIDPHGNGLVSLTTTSNDKQAISYNVNDNTWTTIPSIVTNSIVYQHASMDSSGNAIVIWTENDNTVHAATLPFNGTSLTDSVILSTTADSTTSPPFVAGDANGGAVAVWADIRGGLASARFSFSTKNWTLLPVLFLNGIIPTNISFSGDANGNVVASWTVFVNSNSYIQSAALGAGTSLWGFLSQLSPSSDFDNNSRIILTANGDAVVLWQNNINGSVGTINSAIYLQIFAIQQQPQPPIYFSGNAQNHTLTWYPSPNPFVVQYRLYKNSKLIAIRSPGMCSYKVRHWKKGDTYSLVAVNPYQIESPPLYVEIK